MLIEANTANTEAFYAVKKGQMETPIVWELPNDWKGFRRGMTDQTVPCDLNPWMHCENEGKKVVINNLVKEINVNNLCYKIQANQGQIADCADKMGNNINFTREFVRNPETKEVEVLKINNQGKVVPTAIPDSLFYEAVVASIKRVSTDVITTPVKNNGHMADNLGFMCLFGTAVIGGIAYMWKNGRVKY